MARPPTAEDIVLMIRDHAEDGRSVPEIMQEIEQWAERENRHDVPGERTVWRIVAKHKEAPDQERQQFGFAHWPRSFLSGVLSWEAAGTVLDLIAYREANEIGRPTVRLTRWYGRIRQARPDAPIGEAMHYAAQLAAWERAREREKRDATEPAGIESWLAYRPWSGDDARAAYDAAMRRSGADAASVLGISGRSAALEFIRDALGADVAEQAEQAMEQMERKIEQMKQEQQP